MEPKTRSDDDTGERETSLIINDREPQWGQVNFGSLDAMTSAVTDENGNEGKQIGDSTAIMDMSANATIASKVAPSPNGLTVSVLPGVQPDGKKLNSFSFKPNGSDSLMAPRAYYLSTKSILAGATDKGVVSQTKEMTAKTVNTSVTIFQVPFDGDGHMISDSTGTVKKPSDSQNAALAINKTLTKLSTLAKNKASQGELSKLLFNSKGGLSTEFSNVNNMINDGRYHDSYKQGLAIAIGKNDEGIRDLQPTYIKTELPHQDVYGQFDFIYQSMKSGNGSKYYSPELVSWAQNNADSITHLLMVNYMLQSQFQGDSGGYTTPIRMNKWQESSLPFGKLLKSQGRKNKEPFYLYCGINPKASNLKGAGKDKLPVIPSKYIEPDLAYIFSLYTSIMSQVWIGAEGVNTDGAISQTWQDTVKAMNKRISNNKVSGSKKDLPVNANKVSNTPSEFEQNNLVSGLSTNRGKKDNTSEVYPNKELIGALRVLLSAGENGSGKSVVLLGKSYSVTPIGDTKYSKKHTPSYLYSSFATGGSDMHTRWRTLIESTKTVPLQPAIFKSYWDNSSQSAYIMMPTMLGGTDFPLSLGILMNEVLVAKGGGASYNNLSYANRYIMAFNFKPNSKSKTSNSSGVVEVQTGAEMGKVLDAKKPIVLTGYNGGETFNIVDYFKAQEALNSTMDMPPNKAKTVNNKWVQLKYMNLFSDFFTIPTDKAFVSGGKGEVQYIKGFNFTGYKNNYEANKSKSAISQISPDYSIFFESSAP